jgi:hypothetical protein
VTLALFSPNLVHQCLAYFRHKQILSELKLCGFCFWEYSAAVSRIRLQYPEFLRQIFDKHQVIEEIERSVFLKLRDISVSATKYNTHSSIVCKTA